MLHCELDHAQSITSCDNPSHESRVLYLMMSMIYILPFIYNPTEAKTYVSSKFEILQNTSELKFNL